MGEVDRFNALVAAYTSQRACHRKLDASVQLVSRWESYVYVQAF